MAKPLLRLYTSDGVSRVLSVSFNTTPGTPSAEQTFRLVNDASAGTVDPANQPTVTARQVDQATGDAVLRGLRAVEERWIEIQAVGTGGGGSDQPATGWTPIGRGRSMVVRKLLSGGWHNVKLRYNPPYSAPEGSILFILHAEDAQYWVATDQGHTESSRDGVLSGVGDGLHTELVVGAAITATGTPDDKVNFADEAWVHEGIPLVQLAHALTLSNLDGSGAALASGEHYLARLSRGSGISVVVTKSNKFSGAVNPANVPTLPTGQIDRGYVVRPFSAQIQQADIVETRNVGRFQPTWTAGLILDIGPGRGRVDNTIIRRDSKSSATLTASSTLWVWMLPDSQLAVTTTAARPQARAYLLCKVPTDATSVLIAQLIDYRDPIGPEIVPLRFAWAGVPAASAKAYAVWERPRTGYVRVPRGFILAAASLGSGNTQGELRVQVKKNGTTIFTSFATLDRRPRLVWNGAAYDTAASPEVLAIDPYDRFEAEILYPTAFNGTGPNDLNLTMLVEEH